MRRPLPLIPRGPRRRREAIDQKHLVTLPKLRPDWELAALGALIKPQLGDSVRHRSGFQRFPRPASQTFEQVCHSVSQRLIADLTPHFPPAGDYHAVVEVQDPAVARALGAALSARLPNLWLTVDGLSILAGTFYRRRRRFKLELRPASNVHVRRDLRRQLRGVL